MNRRDILRIAGFSSFFQAGIPSSHATQTTSAQFDAAKIPSYFFDIKSNNRDVERVYFNSNFDENCEYDVVVIGSGMAGGIIATSASNRGMKTLLLDAGGLSHFVHTSNLHISQTLDVVAPYGQSIDSASYGGVAFCFGGKSIFWSNVIPRMEQWELNHWPSEIGRYLLDSGYDLAERLLRKQTSFQQNQDILVADMRNRFTDFQVTNLPRAFHTPAPGQRRGFPDERSTGAFSTAALITSSLANGNRNLVVNFNHAAISIETSKETATGVLCFDIVEKRVRKFKGKKIVLCAGALESPRIALTSNLVDRSGKIGIGPTYHQAATMQFTIPDDFGYLTRFDQAKIFMRPTDLSRVESYTCELALNWQFWDAKCEDDYAWDKRYGNPGPAKSTIKFLFRRQLDDSNSIRLSGDSAEIKISQMSGEPNKSEISNLKNRVIQYFNADKRYIYEPIVYENEGDAYWHIAGSLRMGGREIGVIDENLRFHEYSNLFACDLSIFPDIPAANPSLTLAALAIRLGNHL